MERMEIYGCSLRTEVGSGNSAPTDERALRRAVESILNLGRVDVGRDPAEFVGAHLQIPNV
jgi:hypothetical protein